MPRARRNQFFATAITVSDADRVNAIGFRAEHIVAAITDHQGTRSIGASLLQRIGNQIVLVDARAVELRAEHALEIAVESEMIDDPSREHMRLAGGHEHAKAGLAELRERALDLGIDAVLEQ